MKGRLVLEKKFEPEIEKKMKRLTLETLSFIHSFKIKCFFYLIFIITKTNYLFSRPLAVRETMTPPRTPRATLR